MATLKEQLALVDSLKSELDSMRPLKPDQEQRVFQKLRLEWNYHSNAIEGNQLSQGETRLLLMEGLTAQGKPLKDYLDIQGHNHVIDYLLEFIKRKEELTEAAIREMHRLLLVQSYEVTAVTPEGGQTKKWVKLGQYKEEPNQVKTVTGEIRHFALPSEVPIRMGDLIVRLREQASDPRIHPVAFAALFHHEFVSIHPFDDGNGRMARVLMNLLLMQNHYPPAVIRIQERDKYFAALEQADRGGQEPFAIFIAEQVSSSLQLCIRAAKGEPIEDYDDIDKKITLLARELDSEPEPKSYTPQVFREFVNGSLTRLLTKVFAKLRPFDSFYLTNKTIVNGYFGDRTISKDVSAVISLLLPFQNVSALTFLFIWESFKKAGTKAFNDTMNLSISFQPLTYQVNWGRMGTSLRRLYANELTDEDCLRIANALAEECYQHIQNQRTAQLK